MAFLALSLVGCAWCAFLHSTDLRDAEHAPKGSTGLRRLQHPRSSRVSCLLSTKDPAKGHSSMADAYPKTFTVAQLVPGDSEAQDLYNAIVASNSPALAYAPSSGPSPRRLLKLA
jgi:hypothetical protein